MYKKKIIAICLSLAACVTALSGCSSDETDASDNQIESDVDESIKDKNDQINEDSKADKNDKNESSDDTSEDSGSINEAFGLSKTDLPALEFMQALTQKDVKAIRTFLPWEDTTFILDDDIEWLIARTDFTEVFDLGKDAKDVFESASSVKKDAENKKITFIKGSDTYIVNIHLNDANEWKVALEFDSNFVAENFELELPFTTCYYNGVEITDDYETENDNNLKRTCTLPVVIRKAVTITTNIEGFGEMSRQLTISATDTKRNVVFPLELTPEQEAEFYAAMTEQINAVTKAAEARAWNGGEFNVTDWMPAEAIQRDIDSMTKIWVKIAEGNDDTMYCYRNRVFSNLKLMDNVNNGQQVPPIFVHSVTKKGTILYGCYLSTTCSAEESFRKFLSWRSATKTLTSDLYFTVEDNIIKFNSCTSGLLFNMNVR